MNNSARETLKKYFGYESFREGQEEMIQSILDGNNLIGICPTSFGKSIVFQVPALMMDGITIVISPLISLMKDQVDTLVAKNIPAALLNSTLSESEYREVVKNILNKTTKLLYIAPERFKSESFIQFIKEQKISLLVCDEGHCISAYGHDFRPDYSRIGEYRAAIGNPQCVALTATATPDVREDIVKTLRLTTYKEYCHGFERPNLNCNIKTFESKGAEIVEEKEDRILKIVKKYKTGIVYCSTRKAVDSLSASLKRLGLSCVGYHAGLTEKQREEIQNQFIKKEVDIVVASVAFGMGIDRSDVRFVVCYNISGSIEDLFQQWGRAGRDGQESYCELFYSKSDIFIQKFFLEGKNPDKVLIEKTFQYIKSHVDKNGEIKDSQENLASDIKDYIGSGANPMAISTAINILSKSGVIEKFDLDARKRGTKLVKNVPFASINIDFKSLIEKAARDYRRFSEVVEFSKQRTCPQGNILKYFHAPVKKCGKCSHCTGKDSVK